MRKSQIRLELDLALAHSPGFLDNCRRISASHFTRIRKMPFNLLVTSILQRRGLSLTMELHHFCRAARTPLISKSGYLKQRLKLDPLAFKLLNQNHCRNFYKDAGSVRCFKGHLILAGDGSGINIPTTRETLSNYGDSKTHGERGQAQLGLSCLYDVLNRMILDSTINPGHYDQRQQMLYHLSDCKPILGGRPGILVLDRGYPGLPLLLGLQNLGQKYVVRLPSTCFRREQQGMETDDEWLYIPVDRSRIKHYQGTEYEQALLLASPFHLRMVRVHLTSGTAEHLLTNLDSSEWSHDDIAAIYRSRWGIETAFDELKNKLSLENFTGTRPVLIEQDIYASIYLCNCLEDIIQEIEPDCLNRTKGRHKHPMKVNRNIAIGVFKEQLLHLILEDDPLRPKALYEEMCQVVERNLVPIRPDRNFPRTRSRFAIKYPNNSKRSY